MENAIQKLRHQVGSASITKQFLSYVRMALTKPRMAIAASTFFVFVVSLFTQGFSGSTVVLSFVAALGGGLSGAVTALILVFLRMLLSQDGWKLAAAVLGVGIVAAVFTGSTALEIAMPSLAGFTGYVAGLLLVLNYFVQFNPRTELPMIFGTARWATRDDLANANMIVDAPKGPNLEGTQESGLFLGQDADTGEAIIYDGDMHAITIAPTRTGKDQTAILPNLVRSQGSMIVIDPKGESTRLSANRRCEMGGQVMIVDPWGIAATEGLPEGACIQNARFNPLDRLDANDPDLAGDVMLYADALVMDESQNPHWPNEAKALIAGFIAYIVSEPLEAQRRNLGRLRDILCLPLAQRDKDGNTVDETADTRIIMRGSRTRSPFAFQRSRV